MHLILLVALVAAEGEAPASSGFHLVFGSEDFTKLKKSDLPEDLPASLVLAPDGAFYLTGLNNKREGEPAPDTMGNYVARFAPGGTLQWWKRVHWSMYYMNVFVVAPTRDGGLVIAGRASDSSTGLGSDGLNLFKFDKDGNQLWERSYPTTKICDGSTCGHQDGTPFDVVELADGSFSMLAVIDVKHREEKGDEIEVRLVPTHILVRFDPSGELVSARFLDELLEPSLGTTFFADGSFVTTHDASQSDSLEVVRFDAKGKRRWKKSFKLPHEDFHPTPATTKDGGLFVAAWSGKEGTTTNTYLLRLSADGEQRWAKTMHFPENGAGSPAEAEDGDLGFALSLGEGKASVVRLSPDGEQRWKKTFGERGTTLQRMCGTADNGLLTLGYTKDYGAWYIDLFAVKLDAKGEAGAPVRRPGPAGEPAKKGKGKGKKKGG